MYNDTQLGACTCKNNSPCTDQGHSELWCYVTDHTCSDAVINSGDEGAWSVQACKATIKPGLSFQRCDGGGRRPSPGCIKQPLKALPPTGASRTVAGHIDMGGTKRAFTLYLPKSLLDAPSGQPAPLILGLHGWGMDKTEFVNEHKHHLQEMMETKKAIGVFADGGGEPGKGTKLSWNVLGQNQEDTCGPDVPHSIASLSPDWLQDVMCYESCRVTHLCGKCSWTHCYDDVGFIRQLLDRVEDEYCIDRNRVYAFGASNGGMMVHDLARTMYSRIAAFAALDGGKPHTTLANMKDPALPPLWSLPLNAGPMSLLQITGKYDETIPYVRPGKGLADPYTDPLVKVPGKEGSEEYSLKKAWFYMDQPEVVAAYTQHNSLAHIRDDETPLGPTPDFDGVYAAAKYGTIETAGCNVERSDGAEVVHCSWTDTNGENDHFAGDMLNEPPGTMLFDFFERHSLWCPAIVLND